MKERDKLKEARKRIREIETAVADAHMDYCLERVFYGRLVNAWTRNQKYLKKTRYDAVRYAKAAETTVKLHITKLSERVEMTPQNQDLTGQRKVKNYWFLRGPWES